jgi:hypothetical protein
MSKKELSCKMLKKGRHTPIVERRVPEGSEVAEHEILSQICSAYMWSGHTRVDSREQRQHIRNETKSDAIFYSLRCHL